MRLRRGLPWVDSEGWGIGAVSLRSPVAPAACVGAPVEGLLAVSTEIRAEDGDVYVVVGARRPVGTPAPIDPVGGEGFTDSLDTWTRTAVTKHDPEALNRQGIVQLEDALPKVRFNATPRREQERWSAFARLDYFGSYSEYSADVEGSYKPMPGVELSLSAENVLDNFPDENPFAKNLGSKYPESSPMGSVGGFYHARARYVF